MLCYRNETPIKKITVSGNHPGAAGKGREILGAGQHFVGDGDQTNTGKPYIWTNRACREGEPLPERLSISSPR